MQRNPLPRSRRCLPTTGWWCSSFYGGGLRLLRSLSFLSVCPKQLLVFRADGLVVFVFSFGPCVLLTCRHSNSTNSTWIRLLMMWERWYGRTLYNIMEGKCVLPLPSSLACSGLMMMMMVAVELNWSIVPLEKEFWFLLLSSSNPTPTNPSGVTHHVVSSVPSPEQLHFVHP